MVKLGVVEIASVVAFGFMPSASALRTPGRPKCPALSDGLDKPNNVRFVRLRCCDDPCRRSRGTVPLGGNHQSLSPPNPFAALIAFGLVEICTRSIVA